MGILGDLFGGSESSSQSYIAPQQLPYLTGLWRGAQGYQNQASSLAQMFQPQANQLAGNVTNASNTLDSLAGTGITGEQIGVLQNTLQQNLSENILPALAQGANATGQLGGARQAIAQGQAVRGTQQALSEGVTGILGQDLYRRAAAAQASANVGTAGQAAFSGAANLGFSPYATLGSIIGPPVVLNETTQSQQGGIIPGLAGLAGGVGGFLSGARGLGSAYGSTPLPYPGPRPYGTR